MSKFSFQRDVYKLALAVAIYHLWYERNSRIFNQKARGPESLLSCVVKVIRDRMSSLEIGGEQSAEMEYLYFCFEVY